MLAWPSVIAPVHVCTTVLFLGAVPSNIPRRHHRDWYLGSKTIAQVPYRGRVHTVKFAKRLRRSLGLKLKLPSKSNPAHSVVVCISSELDHKGMTVVGHVKEGKWYEDLFPQGCTTVGGRFEYDISCKVQQVGIRSSISTRHDVL